MGGGRFGDWGGGWGWGSAAGDVHWNAGQLGSDPRNLHTSATGVLLGTKTTQVPPARAPPPLHNTSFACPPPRSTRIFQHAFWDSQHSEKHQHQQEIHQTEIKTIRRTCIRQSFRNHLQAKRNQQQLRILSRH